MALRLRKGDSGAGTSAACLCPLAEVAALPSVDFIAPVLAPPRCSAEEDFECACALSLSARVCACAYVCGCGCGCWSGRFAKGALAAAAVEVAEERDAMNAKMLPFSLLALSRAAASVVVLAATACPEGCFLATPAPALLCPLPLPLPLPPAFKAFDIGLGAAMAAAAATAALFMATGGAFPCSAWKSGMDRALKTGAAGAT